MNDDFTKHGHVGLMNGEIGAPPHGAVSPSTERLVHVVNYAGSPWEVHHREGAFGPSSLLVVLGRLRFLRLRICAELAAWYREFAERAEPSVRKARLRIAEQLERDADVLNHFAGLAD